MKSNLVIKGLAVLVVAVLLVVVLKGRKEKQVAGEAGAGNGSDWSVCD